jgi:hypothetical protein
VLPQAIKNRSITKVTTRSRRSLATKGSPTAPGFRTPLFPSPPADCFTQICARLQCSLLPRMLFGPGPQNAGHLHKLPLYLPRNPVPGVHLPSGEVRFRWLSRAGLLLCQLPGRIDSKVAVPPSTPYPAHFCHPLQSSPCRWLPKLPSLSASTDEKSSRFGAPCFLSSPVPPKGRCFRLGRARCKLQICLSPPAPPPLNSSILQRHHRGLTMVRL